MTSKLSRTALAVAIALAILSGVGCGGGDSDCVAAKKHMCERIPDMNCYAAFMDTAQQKIVNACGQAELDAYIPVVQQACQSSQTTGVPMSCDAIASPTYAVASDGGGSTCDAGAPMQFSYSGAATADGRSATLEFTLSGSSVTNGKLHADSVCSTTVHLNRTDLTFSGTLAGTWESATGTITASWSGGDFACDGTQLTPADGYPTSGSLTISLSGTSVILQRAISGALPYEFAASGHVYVPPAQTACTASGLGGAGGSIDGGGRGGSGGSRDASVTPDAGLCQSPLSLFDNWNTASCSTLTSTSGFSLVSPAQVISLAVWVNTSVAGANLQYTLTSATGATVSSGALDKGSCDPIQSTWCELTARVSRTLAAGAYAMSISAQSICANSGSASIGFVRVTGCAATIAPDAGTADAATADAPTADAGRDVTGGAPTFGLTAATYKGTGTYQSTLSSSSGSATCTATVNITGTVNVTAPGWAEITFTHPTFTFYGEQSCTLSTTETSDEDFYATSHDANGNFVMNAWITGRFDDSTMSGEGTGTSTMGTVVVETSVNYIKFNLSRVN